MTPDQLEAVFAHEAGHVKHWHIAWYVLYWLAVAVTIALCSYAAVNWAIARAYADGSTIDAVVNVVGLLVGFVVFGLLSRGFERQADRFAARRLTHSATATMPARDGTQIFISALGQVARLNNLPLDHHSLTAGRPWLGRLIGRLMHHAATWLHGSIRSRMNHLNRLADSAAAATQFDRAMFAVRCALLGALITSAAAVAYLNYSAKMNSTSTAASSGSAFTPTAARA